MSARSKKYTAVTAAAVMVNYAIGTGMLNLPHTIARASVFTSLIMITIVAYVSYCLARYTLKSLRYSFAMKYHLTIGKDAEYNALLGSEKNEHSDKSTDVTESTSLVVKPDLSIPSNTTLEVSKLCEIYYGKVGFYIYQLALICNLFGCIWGYSEVVSSSLTSVIPFTKNWSCSDPCGAEGYNKDCVTAYSIYDSLALVFGCVLVFVDLSKQKFLQSFFSCCRLVCISLMGLICFISLFTAPYSEDIKGPPYAEDIPMFEFNFKHVGTLFSSATFSLIMHHSIPHIVQPTDRREQKNLDKTMLATFVGLYCFTMVLGFSAAYLFGNQGANLITLNLTKFDGHTWSADSQTWFYKFLSYFIRLLPPIWVLGCLPINGLTLSKNFAEIFSPQLEENKSFQITIKLLAVAPAVILAGFERCLGDIIEFTGLFAYVLLIMPGFLMLRSKKQMSEKFGEKYDPSENRFIDSDVNIWFCIVFNMIGFVFTTYSLIAGLIEE